MDMKEQLNWLLRLQSTEADIARAQKDKAELRKDITNQKKIVENLEKEYEDVHAERIEVQKTGDALEVKIEAKKEENQKLQIQLNSTRSQKDYDAILKKIMNNKADASKWEDEELEKLEKADELKDKEGKIKARIAEAKNTLEETKNRVKEGEKKYDEDIAELTDKMQALRKQIDPKLIAKFEQIHNSKTDNALVKVKGRVCGGCYTRVPKQIENELMRWETIVQCHSCGRILMFDENHAPGFQRGE